MKISNDELTTVISELKKEGAENFYNDFVQNNYRSLLFSLRELQQLREALTWKPASAGINPECDVFEVKLGGENCDIYTALIVGEYYQIGGVHNSREGFYFGQWDLESLLEDYPNFLWREIVEVPTDLPEVDMSKEIELKVQSKQNAVEAQLEDDLISGRIPFLSEEGIVPGSLRIAKGDNP